MNYSEFFQKFYISRSEGGLIGYKSQKKIPEFFVMYALQEEYRGDLLPTSDSAYEKWFKGGESGGSGRNPNNDIWAGLNNHFDADSLLKQLLKALNESKIKELMIRFEVTIDVKEVPDKRRFANAIVAQFEAIAAGKGSADNIVSDEYKKAPEAIGYETYLQGAVDKFKAMRLPNEDEYLLNEFFVCNNIGTAAVVYPHRSRGNVIEDATMEKIRTFDPRGEVWCALIIGACGYGKTIMLQHLFLEAAERRSETGCLPVFAELRHFSARHNTFLEFLVETMREYDPDITEEKAVELLMKGQMQILLDGLDEMDPEETNNFQRKLGEFRQHYRSNQIVISSRQCTAISGIRNCVKLYLHPLDETQSKDLIEKLLQGDDEDAALITSFMEPDKGYIQKNGFIATNPMLLTIMVRRREELSGFQGDKLKFYEMMYDALIRQHDEEKQAFGRFFHSVYDGDEFTQVFREFCAKSYLDRVYRFDHRSFEKYFQMVKKSVKLQNPGKFQLRAFQQDVCATSCMMYEQESGFYYIDPGFQDYFFAEYYYFAEPDPTKDLGKSLWNMRQDPNRNIDAYRMFCQMAPEKANVCFFLPYLESIFKGKTDEEAFRNFLAQGYGTVRYAVVDSSAVQQEMSKYGVSRFEVVTRSENECHLMLRLIYDMMKTDIHFELFSMVQALGKAPHASHQWVAHPINYSDSVPPHPSQIMNLDGQQVVRIYSGDPNQYLALTEITVGSKPDGMATVGYTYTIDIADFPVDSMEVQYIIKLCRHPEVGMYETFEAIRSLYEYLVEQQQTNAYR